MQFPEVSELEGGEVITKQLPFSQKLHNNYNAKGLQNKLRLEKNWLLNPTLICYLLTANMLI